MVAALVVMADVIGPAAALGPAMSNEEATRAVKATPQVRQK
jgi:hypothetical protein